MILMGANPLLGQLDELALKIFSHCPFRTQKSLDLLGPTLPRMALEIDFSPHKNYYVTGTGGAVYRHWWRSV